MDETSGPLSELAHTYQFYSSKKGYGGGNNTKISNQNAMFDGKIKKNILFLCTIFQKTLFCYHKFMYSNLEIQIMCTNGQCLQCIHIIQYIIK